MEKSQPNRIKIEPVDVMFITGVLLLGVGLAFWISWQAALAVVGGVLIGMSFWLTLPVGGK